MTSAVSPLDRPPTRRKLATLIAGAGAAATHAAVVALALLVGSRLTGQAKEAISVSQMVELDLPPEVAPAAEKGPIHEQLPAPSVHAAHAVSTRPPAAAAAAQVLTAAHDEVDFGDTFVVGKGAAYAGGTTDETGSGTHAVHDQAARGNSPAPSIAAAPPPIDHTRAPQLAGGSAWDCPFPAEADDAGEDHAVVSLRVEVGADGQVRSANAIRDPGHGFGREARRCALSKRWSPGLDRMGSATTAVTVVNVRFNR